MRKVKIIAAFGALAILLAGASDALAQPDVVRARKELEITQIVIDKARRLVEESGNRRAEDPLRRAIDVQRQAAAELSANGAHVSMRLTMIARDYAKRAAKLAAEPSENKEFVFRELQRTSDILRRVREELREGDDLHATDLLRTALERHEEAESSFRELQFRVALRLTVLARELAQKALDLSVGEPGAGPDMVKRAVEKTDEVLGRVTRDLEGERPPLLDEAFRLQDKAETDLREGRLGPALKLTLTARDLATRALGEAVEDGAGAVQGEIDATRDFLSAAGQLAEERGSQEASALVREGHSHLEEAEAYYAKGEHVAARAQLKLARRKAERAMEVAGG